MEAETLAEKEVIVETDNPAEEVVTEMTTLAEEEPTITVGTEETSTTSTTAGEEPPTTVEAEPTVPHEQETTGEPLPVITITYPLQNSLDCPHCSTNFPEDRLEDL